jgi:hypothetical protein
LLIMLTSVMPCSQGNEHGCKPVGQAGRGRRMAGKAEGARQKPHDHMKQEKRLCKRHRKGIPPPLKRESRKCRKQLPLNLQCHGSAMSHSVGHAPPLTLHHELGMLGMLLSSYSGTLNYWSHAGTTSALFDIKLCHQSWEC